MISFSGPSSNRIAVWLSREEMIDFFAVLTAF